MNTKVTIGITTYNLEKYIAQALESLLIQKTNFGFKILVVDDGSTDNTQAILQDYKQKHPDKVDLILKEKNEGSLESSNMLFNQIKTEYFSFLDGDDYWLDENRLQKQVDFLDAHPEYTMVGGNTIYLKENQLAEKVISNKYLDKTFEWKDKVEDRCPFVHTSAILLRNVVYKDGMPSGYIQAQKTMDNSVYRGEDIRFLHHLEKGKLYIFPEDFSVYRIHDAGLWSSSSINKRLLEGMISNMGYMDIFPSATIKWNKDFVAQYRMFFEKLKDQYTLSEKESDYLQYVLTLLKTKKIDWLSVPSPKNMERKVKLKYKVFLFLYNKLREKLLKKGLIQ